METCDKMFLKKLIDGGTGVVVHTFNPSTLEAETGRYLPVRGHSDLQRVLGSPGIQGETLSQKPEEKRSKRRRRRRSSSSSSIIHEQELDEAANSDRNQRDAHVYSCEFRCCRNSGHSDPKYGTYIFEK